ncbi:MAG: hypothetical protein SV760_02055, partial [Halobacteria archaeon]|nr:hypothetical protein [Halobacteria archaeon]
MRNGVSSIVEEVFWWFGWHQKLLVMGGIVLGILSGYGIGVTDSTGLMLGLLIVVLGILSRSLFYLQLTGVVVAGVALYVVGGRPFLSMVGLGPESGVLRFVAEILLVLPNAVGANPSYSDPVSAVARSVSGLTTTYLAGLVLGISAWASGAAVVNTTYQEVYDSFIKVVNKKGKSSLGDGTYTTSYGVGSHLGLKPSEKYHATNINPRENSIILHYGSMLKMPRKAVNLSGSTKQIYYDQIISVDYNSPRLEIRLADGEIVKIITSEDPNEILNDIRDRLQRYKSGTVETTEREPEEGVEEEAEQEIEEEPEAEEMGEEEIDEASRKRAEEAVEDMEEVIENTLDEMGDTFDVMSSDETEDEESSQ